MVDASVDSALVVWVHCAFENVWCLVNLESILERIHNNGKEKTIQLSLVFIGQILNYLSDRRPPLQC